QLSAPLVIQPLIGLGSWFIFMSLIENLGPEATAITVLVQMVYLVLSIPSWGFSASVGTLVGGFIGHHKRQAVIPIIWKTSYLSLFVTLLITLPVVCFPHFFIGPFLGEGGYELIVSSRSLLYVLILILVTFSVGSVLFSGVSGVGASAYALRVQMVAVVLYLTYIYVTVQVLSAGLVWNWLVEAFYWLLVASWSLWYLYSKRWYGLL
ncbi:MAG: MATE family efflux transporter, partial [Bacteroidota bacterium]